MLARRTINRPPTAPPTGVRPVAGAAGGLDAPQLNVPSRDDALAGLLSRAVAGRHGPLLQRSPATAAKAMVAAKIDKFNKGTYEAWLTQRSELDGRKGTNAVLHEVDAGHIKEVRIAYDALVAEAKAGAEEKKAEKPTRFVATGKKAQAAAKLSAPVKAKQTVNRPPSNEMTWAYGAEHGDLHFDGKPTKNKTKWSLAKPTAIALMEAEIEKHLDRMVRDSSVVEGEWTTWYIAHEPGYEVGKYFITPRESGSTNTFSMQVQVSLTDKHISFHGYPDEQVRGRGIGPTRNKIA